MEHAYLLVEPLELFAKWHVVDRRSLCSFDYHVESEVMMPLLGNPKVPKDGSDVSILTKYQF